MVFTLLAERGARLPGPAVASPVVGDDQVEPHVPWVERQAGMLLERVREPDQAGWPGRCRKGAVIVAAATAETAAGVVPRHQRQHGDGLRQVASRQRLARRLGEAEGPRPRDVAEVVLGEVHDAARQAGQEHPLAGGVRRRDQRAGRNLIVAVEIGEQQGRGAPGVERQHGGAGGGAGGGHVGWAQRTPSPAHRVPNRCL